MPAATANNFRFINSYSSTGPKTAKDTRRDVRSYVARVSHTNTKHRSGGLKDEKHGGTVVFDVEITAFDDDKDDSPPLSAPVTHRRKLSPPKKLPSPSYTTTADHRQYATEQVNFNTVPAQRSQSTPMMLQQSQSIVPIPASTTEHQRYPFTYRQISPLHRLSTYTISPISGLPVYHLSYVPGILDNYISKLAVPIPEIDNNSPRPLIRTQWLPMVVHSPAIFHVIVLLSAAYYAVYAEPSQYPRMYTEILALKQQALKGLIIDMQNVQSTGPHTKDRNPSVGSAHSSGSESNDSAYHSLPENDIVREARRTSLSNSEEECVIAAIAKMASYEAMFGDDSQATAYHTHMRALVALLKRRGGLASLGQDGMLSRLLRFIDTNSAFLLGTNLYLSDDDGVGVCLPRHYPFKAKRFSEMEAQGVKPGQILQDRTINSQAFTEGTFDKERFVGLCCTGDAIKF